MIDERFVILGTIISFFAGLNYLILTLKGRVRPNRVSFLLWGVAPMIAFAASINEGVGLTSLLTFSVGFNPLLIFIATYISKKAVWELELVDYICGVFAILALILWGVTKDATLAIFFSILADGVASIPTIIKSLKDPESESAVLFALSGVSATITILTIDKWNFAYYAFPVYILAIDIIISATVYFKLGPVLGILQHDTK